MVNQDLNFDFDPQLFADSAKFVISKDVERGWDAELKRVKDVGNKIDAKPIGVPQQLDIEKVNAKFKIFCKRLDVGQSVASLEFSRQELRQISYFPDYFIKTPSEQNRLIRLLGDYWHDRYLSGLIYFLLNKWNLIEFNVNFKDLKVFILNKLDKYQGNRRSVLGIKANRQWLTSGSPARLGALLLKNGESVTDATRYLGLSARTFNYGYFDKVLFVYYRNCLQYDNDVAHALILHSSAETKKAVISSIIVNVDEHHRDDLMGVTKSAALALVGNPNVNAKWGTEGHDAEVATLIKQAQKILNKWIILEYINVVFDKIFEDPARKSFWLKYVDYITFLKVVGSPLNEERMRSIPGMQASMGYYFKTTTNEYRRRTCSLVLKIKNKYFVEFSDSGALYVYDDSSEFSKSLAGNIAHVDDLKNPSIGNLVIEDNWSSSYYETGKMNHAGYWQRRLMNWFEDRLGIRVREYEWESYEDHMNGLIM